MNEPPDVEAARSVRGTSPVPPSALDALRESEARFRATFERAPVGLAHVGIGGEWLAVRCCARKPDGGGVRSESHASHGQASAESTRGSSRSAKSVVSSATICSYNARDSAETTLFGAPGSNPRASSPAATLSGKVS